MPEDMSGGGRTMGRGNPELGYKKSFNVREKKNKVPAYIAAMAKTPGYAAGEKANPVVTPKPKIYNPRLPNIPTGPAIGGTDWEGSANVPANAGNPRLPVIPPATPPAFSSILAAFGIKPPATPTQPATHAATTNLSGGVPREPGERLSTNDFTALTTYAPPINYMLPEEPAAVSVGGGYGYGGGGGGGGGGRRGYTPYPPYTPKTYTPTEYEKWLRELLGRWNI